VSGNEVDTIGKALNGQRKGNGYLCSCPVPAHGIGRGDRNPSLSVSESADGRLLMRCFAGCTFDDIRAELEARGLLDNKPSPVNRRKPIERATVISQLGCANLHTHTPDPAALDKWRTSRPGEGTLVEDYLNRRGILIVPPSIRFSEASSQMVAGVQAPDGRLIAIQTTLLTAAAERGDRRTCGSLGAGAFRGGPAAETMGIAEGVETALSAQQIFGMSVWASLGASRLNNVDLPAGVREVHICSDNDQPGRVAADKAAFEHHRLGRKVIMHFPADGFNDFNDVLIADADRDFVEGGAE
jgi:hypothetical protein